MNVCLDARTATRHFPGIGRYTFNLARALTPLLGGHDRLVILRDPRMSSHWQLDPLRTERVAVVDVPMTPFSMRQQWSLPRRLRQLGVDVYHSPFYLMPLRPGVPSVVTIHDLIPLHDAAAFTPLRRRAFRMATRLAVRVAREIIAVSRVTAADIERLLGVPPDRIRVISEAPDPCFRPQPEEVTAALRRRYGLIEPYALYCGSNKPHKNLVRLVEAWARVRSARPCLVVAGKWDERYPEAQQHVRALGLGPAVRFLGGVDEAELPALYSGATLFVFPSLYEGFGLPVLEAMACGVPVACADGSSLTEVAGDAAVRFDPCSADAIAAAVQELLSDAQQRRRFVERGVQRAAQFSWEATARLTLDTYRRAMA